MISHKDIPINYSSIEIKNQITKHVGYLTFHGIVRQHSTNNLHEHIGMMEEIMLGIQAQLGNL